MTLPDEVMACNMIKNMRRCSARRKKKGIVARIGKDDDGRAVSIRLIIHFNPSTGGITYGHSLRYRRHDIYPTTNKKLLCSNAHALRQLEKNRAYQREYRRAAARATT